MNPWQTIAILSALLFGHWLAGCMPIKDKECFELCRTEGGFRNIETDFDRQEIYCDCKHKGFTWEKGRWK